MTDYSFFPLALYTAFSALAVLFAIGVVTLKNPVHSAFSLVMVLFNVAAIFAMLEAHFVAAVQILIYAGAIMVLFVFVIMLLNLDELSLDFPILKYRYVLSFIISASVFVLLMLSIIKGGSSPVVGEFSPQLIANLNGGNIRTISLVMFSNWIYTFELVGFLLTMAVVGAVVLAKRKVD